MPSKPKPSDVLEVFTRLNREYPNAETELIYEDPWQLLIAVILSAQCTDERVNRTTPGLFAHFPTPKALAEANPKEVEKLIHSCGFFRMKAKSIIHTSRDLVDRFGGRVPQTLEELVTLAGVGRKTASVVLSQAFDIPAIAVDTHVNRVANRLGWAHSPQPEKIEIELKEAIPMSHWSSVNSLLILHGRRICKARKPLCESCSIAVYCSYFRSLQKSSQRKQHSLNKKK